MVVSETYNSSWKIHCWGSYFTFIRYYLFLWIHFHWQINKLLPGESFVIPAERSVNLKPVARYVKFIVERSRFIKLRKSVSVIQKAVRRHQSNLHHELKAAFKIQLAWRSYKEKVISSITIQSYVRGWITRRINWTYKFSSILIQVRLFKSSDVLLMELAII